MDNKPCTPQKEPKWCVHYKYSYEGRPSTTNGTWHIHAKSAEHARKKFMEVIKLGGSSTKYTILGVTSA